MSRPKSKVDRWRWYWRLANWSEALQVRLLGTSFVSLLVRIPVLLLETTGRTTGRRRRAAVAYWEVGETIFIGGGAAGMSRVDWIANVRANPDAIVWLRRRRIPVQVHPLTGDGYEKAWAYAYARWPKAAKYERLSGRPVPYFRVERRDGLTR